MSVLRKRGGPSATFYVDDLAWTDSVDRRSEVRKERPKVLDSIAPGVDDYNPERQLAEVVLKLKTAIQGDQDVN
jgi:hypothetical protein